MSHVLKHKLCLFAILCGLAVIVVVAQTDEYHGNSDGIVFPGPIEETGKSRGSTVRSSNRMGSDGTLARSLQLAKQLNSINSIDEFLKMVKGVPRIQNTLAGRIAGGSETRRSNAERPIIANCIPELQPVELKQEIDPSTIYYPSCTRVKRCGGCCSHSMLSCQPTATVFRNFEVVVVSVGTSEGELSYKGKQIVPIEEHTKCECDCRIKEKDCNIKQIYEPAECSCVCNNVDEAEKCFKNNDTKLWNSDHCACFCREEKDCSTGFYFDQNTCRCERPE